jgi:hypothetical protein
MRHSKEKNNDRFNDHWPFLFNAVINSFDLREIELIGLGKLFTDPYL